MIRKSGNRFSEKIMLKQKRSKRFYVRTPILGSALRRGKGEMGRDQNAHEATFSTAVVCNSPLAIGKRLKVF
jgi:hypothetical protein